MLEQYSQEFSAFKPDKKLRWLAHLGTVHLELQLGDRTVDAHVPPLEAAFIELFSEQGQPMCLCEVQILISFLIGIWTLDELALRVGSIDRSAAVKALMTWIDLGVLKEESENTFKLLETVDDGTADPRAMAPKPGKLQSRAQAVKDAVC